MNHIWQTIRLLIRSALVATAALVAFGISYYAIGADFFGDRPSNFEKAIQIVGSIVTALAALFAIFGAEEWLSKFYVAHGEAQKLQRNQSYASLDDFYIKILSIAIDKPYLRMIAPVKDDLESLDTDYAPFSNIRGLDRAALNLSDDSSLWTDEETARYYKFERVLTEYRSKEYDAYAFMVWNFLEAIHDKCQDDDELLNTWAPIIAAEDAYHRGWFLQQMREQARLEVEHVRKHASSNPATKRIRSDKFCAGFQVFIFDRNFTEDPRVDRSSPISKRLNKWSYENAKNKTREFISPPTALIDDVRQKVWPHGI